MSRNAPQLPNTASTSAVAPIPSSAGYAAGELIYYSNGDYGTIPNSAASTAPFNITVNQGPANGATGGTTNWAGTSGGSKTRGYAAVLTNGNIVQVFFARGTYYPSFRVVDTSNAEVVATTTISSTYTQSTYADIAVCALSGGGFAVMWHNDTGGTTNYPCYAVYTNTGSVTTSAFQDLSEGNPVNNNVQIVSITAQPNGGFVGAYIDNAYNIATRTYNASGTATASWLTIATALSSVYSYGFDVAVRSDSTFIVVWTNNSTTVGQYNVISATNVAITGTQSYTSTVGASAFNYGSSVCCLSNDTFIIGYRAVTSSSTYVYAFRPLPVGNVLGTEVALPTTGLSIGGSAGYINLRSISSGANFVFAFGDSTRNVKYCVYNSSYALQSGSAAVSLYSAQTGPYIAPTIIDYTGYVVIYTFPAGYNALGVIGQSYTLVSKTGYAVVPFGTTTAMTIGTATASVNGYARSASTPTKASFFAANTEGVSGSGTVSTSATNVTTIENAQVESIHCAVFPDGRFAVGYVNYSTYVAKVAVYSQAGVLLSTITLPVTAYGSASPSAIRVTCLTSNKLVVGLYTGSNTVTTYVYSSAYVLLATSSTTTAYMGGMSYAFGLASLSNDRYVLAYSDSGTGGYLYYKVFDSTAAVVAGPSTAHSASSYSSVYCASTQNGFLIGGYYNGGAQYATYVANTSGNTFSASGVFTAANNSSGNYGAFGAATPNGVMMQPGASSGTSASFQLVNANPGGTGYYVQVPSTANSTSFWILNGGFTSAGNAVVVLMDATNSPSTRLFCFPPSGWDNSDPSTWPSGTVTSLGLSIAPTTSTGALYSPQPCMAPLYGHTMLLCWKDANSYPTFGFINAYPWTYSTSLTSGVTTSASAFTVSPPNGYVFKGVSTTSAAAGGVGQVQLNGPAQLNTNYSASTAPAAFDFQQPNGTNIDGVKGTISGRVVNLTGNN